MTYSVKIKAVQNGESTEIVTESPPYAIRIKATPPQVGTVKTIIAKGDTGASAYELSGGDEVWGNIAAWKASLKGADGANGTNVITLTMGDGINPILAGSSAITPPLPYAATIKSWTLIEASPSPVSATMEIDVRKGAVADYPTTASIAAATKPALTAQKVNYDAVLFGWTTAIAAGDIIKFVVDSNTAARKIILALKMEK